MRETDWLAAVHPGPMLEHLIYEPGNGLSSAYRQRTRPLISARKLRLWVVAMYQASERKSKDQFPREWVTGEAEGGGDGVLGEARLWTDDRADLSGDPPMNVRAQLLREVTGNPFRPVVLPVTEVKCPGCAGTGCQIPWSPTDRVDWRWMTASSTTTTYAATVACKACLGVGKVPGPCLWLTPEVKGLAQDIWQNQRWDLMSVLSDALEEAGCCDEACQMCQGTGEVLSLLTGGDRLRHGCAHCGGLGRKTGTGRQPHRMLEHLRAQSKHVRGCWCVDLLMGET